MKSSDIERLNDEMKEYRGRVEGAISNRIASAEDGRQRLYQAMRYGVLNGGKRVRAILVYAAGTALDAPQENLDTPAVAVELMHAYSLIHDDLPAMDDDDFRRGQPTCHRAFDEATALLAGDALQCLAFEVLSGNEGLAGPEVADFAMRLAWIRILSEASGALGMARHRPRIGGQTNHPRRTRGHAPLQDRRPNPSSGTPRRLQFRSGRFRTTNQVGRICRMRRFSVSDSRRRPGRHR